MKNFSLPTRSAFATCGLAGLAVFTSSPLAGAQVKEDLKLLPNDGAVSEEFGNSVAISGTTAVVGAWEDDDNGWLAGSAYVFDVTTGQQLAKLLSLDGGSEDTFGLSVAISEGIALVGAPGDNDNGSKSGSAYVFDVTTGQQLAKLLPMDGAAFDSFGRSVAVSGATAVVGAVNDDDNGPKSGSAYVFDVTTGQQLAKLLPTDGAAEDRFGVSVAISGAMVLVGAFRDDDNGSNSGSAYVFDVTTGQQLAKLLPTDGALEDNFGYSVAASGATALVGAFRDDENGTDSGSVYAFDVTTGQQLAKLLPTDGNAQDFFGISVAVSGTTAFVGALLGDGNDTDSGSAYVFDVTTGQQLARLVPTDGSASDHFGVSVAVSGATAVVGALGDDDNGSQSGSAYVFDPDCNANGVSDFSELADPSNDWNGDGVLDSCVSANYCDAENNSTGLAAVIGADGSPVTGDNAFTLEAWDLPLNEFAYFLASESTAFVPGFGGSSGNLCLGPPIIRFNNPAFGGKILNSGNTGTVSFTLDLTFLPQGITFDPGELWYFQLWYRDYTTGPTSNTTDGIEIMFR